MMGLPGTIDGSEIEFMSPDGNAIAGIVQTGGEAPWPCLWDENCFTGYKGDGPDGGGWESVQYADNSVFLDDTGDTWLEWHLIRTDIKFPHPETHGLSPETCARLQEDILYAKAVHELRSVCHELGRPQAEALGIWQAKCRTEEYWGATRARAEEAFQADLLRCTQTGWDDD